MKNVKFKTIYKTKKFSIICKTRDSISMEQKSNVIYKIIFPGCFQKYVCKTDRNIITCPDEHSTKFGQLMYQHLSICSEFNGNIMVFTIADAKNYIFIMSLLATLKIQIKPVNRVKFNFVKYII